jgi:1,4-dihydroxy-2-naphthoate octaprenyltransferase
VLIGVLSIASGIAYTGGPYPLGYNGLGDLFVFVFFGLVAVCGTCFVESGQVPALAIYCALPVGAIATAVLVVNNVRDHATDVKAGKRTLVVRFGRSFGVVEYLLLLALAYGVPSGLFMAGLGGRSLLLPLLTLPLAAPLCRSIVRDREGARLNRTLAGTARLLLFFGVLFAIGIVLK